MFDLDFFKDVNDKHGHLCGDAVLAAVGSRMNAVLRGSDLKCRYGGEEFLILLPDAPLAGARRVAETLRGISRTSGSLARRNGRGDGQLRDYGHHAWRS
jgi:diguanylate cyclase (GGDEF)-like protein